MMYNELKVKLSEENVGKETFYRRLRMKTCTTLRKIYPNDVSRLVKIQSL